VLKQKFKDTTEHTSGQATNHLKLSKSFVFLLLDISPLSEKYDGYLN